MSDENERLDQEHTVETGHAEAERGGAIEEAAADATDAESPRRAVSEPGAGVSSPVREDERETAVLGDAGHDRVEGEHPVDASETVPLDGARFADLPAGAPFGPPTTVLPAGTGGVFAQVSAEAAPQERIESPRTRWAAIIWGVVLATSAGAGLWTVVVPARFDAMRIAAVDALLGMNPVSVTIAVLLVAGALVLVTGLVGLVRRLQRRLADRA